MWTKNNGENMGKQLKSYFKLSDPEKFKLIKEQAEDTNPKLSIGFDQSNNTVSVTYKGKEFRTTSTFDGVYDDTIILDPKKHRHLKNDDLIVLGVYFHVDDIGLKMNKDIMYLSIDGSSETPEFLKWQYRPDHILAEFLVDPQYVKKKFRYTGTKHQRTLDYLESDSDITILYNGIMDAGKFAQNRHAVQQINSEVPIKIQQFGKIIVRLNVGFPNTVGELINYVKQYKKKLYKRVR